jgi:TRAP-type C4-dicarboxylate transport system permease small subunit
MKVLSALKNINNICVKLSKYFLMLCLGSQLVIVFAAVIFRYFLKRPLSWGDELATFIMIYLTFFGSFVALDESNLARIEILVNKLKGRQKKIITVIGYILTLAILAIVLYYSTTLYFSITVQRQVSPAMRMPLKVFYIAIPITMIMMMNRVIISMLELFLPKNDGGSE